MVILLLWSGYTLGVPPVRVEPGYPAGSPARVLPVTGSESDSKPAGFFGPGTRVPEYSSTRPELIPWYPVTRVPVRQRVSVVGMPDNNLQKPFKHATNDPAQYSYNTYQQLCMKL